MVGSLFCRLALVMGSSLAMFLLMWSNACCVVEICVVYMGWSLGYRSPRLRCLSFGIICNFHTMMRHIQSMVL